MASDVLEGHPPPAMASPGLPAFCGSLVSDDNERYARLAARVLREETPTREIIAGDGRRDAVIAAMALAIAAKVRRCRNVLGTSMLLAVAAGEAPKPPARVRRTRPPCPASPGGNT
jgi:hypothetical protein